MELKITMHLRKGNILLNKFPHTDVATKIYKHQLNEEGNHEEEQRKETSERT